MLHGMDWWTFGGADASIASTWFGLRHARLKVVVLHRTVFSSLWCSIFEFWVLRFRDLGASFSRFGCFVFEFWVLRFRVLGASFSRFGCFVLRSSFSSASFSKLPTKDTDWKRKFKRMLSFLFVDKRKLFAMKLSFEEVNLVFFTADQSAWLILNQPRQRGFWRNLRYILRCIFVFIKVSWTFSSFFNRRGRKTPQNVHWNWFFALSQPI